MSATARLRATVLPPAGAGRVSASALADAVGSGLFMSSAVLYFSQRIGLGAVTIGTGLGIAGVVALLVVAPLGAVADRTGFARTLRLTHLLRTLLFPLYLLVHDTMTFVVVVTLITVCDRLAAPMFHGVVGTAVGDDVRTETMGYVRALRNAGFSLGALLAGLAIGIGTTTAYDTLVLGNAASFLVAFLLLVGIPNVREPRGADTGPRLRGIRPRYLGLAGLNVVLLLHDMLLLLALPLYIVEQTDVPPPVLPLLFALNTVLVVLLQRRLSRRATTVAGAARALRSAGWYLAAACACLAVTALVPPLAGIVVLVLGVVLLTLGESLQVAGSWELSYKHAPAATRGAHLAVFSLGLGVQRSLGPVVLSLLTLGGVLAWLPMGAAFVAAGALARRVGDGPWPEVRRDPEGKVRRRPRRGVLH